MACELHCNGRARAARGGVNAGKLLILLSLWGVKAGGRRGRGHWVLTLCLHNVDILMAPHGWPAATAHPEAA